MCVGEVRIQPRVDLVNVHYTAVKIIRVMRCNAGCFAKPQVLHLDEDEYLMFVS